MNNFALIHIIYSNLTSDNFILKKWILSWAFFIGNIIYEYYIRNNPRYINIIINYMKFFEYYIKIEKDKFSSLFKYIMNKYFNNDYLSYLPFDKKKI